MSAAMHPGGVPSSQLRHLGVLRAVAHLPAVVGSVGILLVFLTFLGGWEPAAILSWFAIGLATADAAGGASGSDRGVRLSPAQRRAARPLSTRRGEMPSSFGPRTGKFDLFVRRDPAPNAYAVGSRSIAVTTGLLEEFLAQRLRREHVTAVLLHERGHLRGGGTRFDLVAGWLTMPWRVGAGLAVRFGLRASASPAGPLAGVVIAGFIVAVTIAVRHGDGESSLCSLPSQRSESSVR